VGVVVGRVNRFIPMAGSIRSILNSVLVIGVVLWLLKIFRLFSSPAMINVENTAEKRSIDGLLLGVILHVAEHPLFHRDGDHLICEIPITYAQACLGAELEAPTLTGRQPLKIPRGTQSGEVFRMRGHGMPRLRGGGPGDLLVQVAIEVPKKLTEGEEELLRQLAELEQKQVSPKRKSFFDRLKDFFAADDDPHAPTETP
jgi:DnaJ-class molecular chaperone